MDTLLNIALYPIFSSLLYDFILSIPYLLSIFTLFYCVYLIPYLIKKFM